MAALLNRIIVINIPFNQAPIKSLYIQMSLIAGGPIRYKLTLALHGKFNVAMWRVLKPAIGLWNGTSPIKKHFSLVLSVDMLLTEYWLYF